MTKEQKHDELYQFSSLRKTRKAYEFRTSERSVDEYIILLEIVQFAFKKSTKKKSKINWVDISDIIYSIYIRIREADENGDCTCCTCGDKHNWKEIQNGHYRTRGCYKYRYDDMNCNPQCAKCNLFLNGNYRSYYLFIINLYGKEVEEMLWNDKELVKRDNDWYITHLLERWDKIKFFKKRLGDK